MCGITGFFDTSTSSSQLDLNNMVETISHRGPDDFGSFTVETGFGIVGLGHTRLSVIDLSSAGHQPMKYAQYKIVYNGEIYNYLEIKKELIDKGHSFSSNTDTEVILHAFQEWGVKCVDRFIGMFAFVIYDSKKQKIYGFRDRAGVKPFYYYMKDGLLLFGSELKAIHSHPSFEKIIDEKALKLYFDFGYIPAPYSIFQNTHKLTPGSYFEFNLPDSSLHIIKYWEPLEFYKRPKLKESYSEIKSNLHDLLKSACKYRMVSDVPVGVFLSGGYDSTAVAAIIQESQLNKIKTFTIGFEDGNNEAPYAKETAKYLGTDHYEYNCTTKDAQDIIPELANYYDEPFADSSAIPTILVSKFAKKQVTVALSADGGDELFGGYTRYLDLFNYYEKLNKIPASLNSFASYLSFLGAKLFPGNINMQHRFVSVASALKEKKPVKLRSLYKMMHCLPQSYHTRMFHNNFDSYATSFDFIDEIQDNKESPLFVDYTSYMSDDILTKVDRATMSVSLEGREPFLDHRLLEFAAAIPLKYKIQGNSGKQILKDIVHDYVPMEIMNRPKSGFSIPLTKWLKGDLNNLLMDTLGELTDDGIINTSFVKELLKDFNSDRLHYTPLLWKLLMFKQWKDKWMN